MANLPESNEYSPNEATSAGLVNIPAQQLAKRTDWLKARVDALVAAVVAATVATAGIVRLSSATNSSSDTLAATPAAVKAANDNAETRALKSTTITGSGMVKGGGGLGQHRILTISEASLTEAMLGEATDVAISPRRLSAVVASALVARGIGAAAASVTNLDDLADMGGMGSANGTPVNGPGFDFPAVLNIRRGTGRNAQLAMPSNGGASRLAVRSQNSAGDFGAWAEAWMGEFASANLTTSRWQKLPSGLIIQWMHAAYNASDGSGGTVVTLPVAFPNTCFRAWATDVGAGVPLRRDPGQCVAIAPVGSRYFGQLHQYRWLPESEGT